MIPGKNDISNKIFFILLLLIQLQTASFELTIASLTILSLFFINKGNQKISKDFITIILFLLLIFILGIASTFFYSYAGWDIGRDISYFLKPTLLLFLGYMLIQNIKDYLFLFKAFVYLGIGYAIFHLYTIITYPSLFTTTINTFRYETGLSNHIELIASLFLILSLKYPRIRIFKNRSWTYMVLGLLFISFFLYFSRTMWVAIILLLIGSFGYSRISLKAIKYISLALILIFSLYVYLYSIDIERDQKGFSAFLYKVKIAPEEIFHTNIDINNHVDLWDHWRAYEANMAFAQMKGFQHIYGRGLGSLVDLHFVAPLNDKGMQFISHLHNGYAMVYYKTGVFGLFIYLLFLINLYLFAFKKRFAKFELPITNLIASIGIYLAFSSLIITGVYNLNDVYLFALGGLLSQYDKLRTKELIV